MTPCGKTFGYVRYESDSQQSSDCADTEDEYQFCKFAAPEKRNDQECHKEYQSRTKVIHDGKTAQAEYRKEHEHGQVLFFEQFVECGCANKNESDLYNFRGLHQITADADPVAGAVQRVTGYDIEQQQSCAEYHQDRTDLYSSVEITYIKT